jgi:hypothetical protein
MNVLIKTLNYFLIMLLITKISACNFAPGSYPYAEEYEINVPESTLIKAINDFKENNPQYIVPNRMLLIDGRTDEKDHWYHIYFYYPEENQIVYGWTRPSGKNITTFAFVSINNSLTLGNWKDINKDFSDSENKVQKNKFEERILNKIKGNL